MVYKILLSVLLSSTVVFSQTFWQRTEPYAGSFNKMYFGGGDTIYGTMNSGFSRSTNNGLTWSAAVVVNFVTDMAVAPNGNIFLSQNQQKISRSTNKGTNWTITGTGINEPSCNTVMVTSTGVVLAGTIKGIYRSTNNGDAWTKVAGGAELAVDSSISAMATFDGNTLYAFSSPLPANQYRGYAFHSTDNGITWIKGTNSLDTVVIYKAVVHSNGTIYVTTGNGIRYSSDGGNSWGVFGFYGKYIGGVSFDQSGAVYASVNYTDTTAVLYKTINNGSSWLPMKTPYNGISGIAINKQGHIFLSQDQLYRSTDNGGSWNAFPVGYPEVKYMTESSKHELFFTAGGFAYQNLYRSSDFGQSWHIQYTGVVGIPIVGFYGDTLFVGDNYYQSTVYRSSDNGKTFKLIPNNTGLSGIVNALLGTSYTSLLAGTSAGILRSKDHGKSWEKVANGSTSSLKQSSNGTLYALKEVINDGIYRSNDSGTTWQQKITGMANVISRSLAISSNGNLFCGTDGGIFRSTNNGDVWVRIDTQKTNKPSGQFVTINRDGKIFVGGTAGGSTNSVYQSTDNGVSWTLLPDDIFSIDNQSKVRQLFVSSNGSLFAGTTVGLYRSKNVTNGVELMGVIIPSKFSLEQNYPNPFNPSTNIRFTVHNDAFTSLIVYDVLGKEITTLVNEQLTAGSYETTFNGTKLVSGIYFYRLINGSSTQMKKMILLK